MASASERPQDSAGQRILLAGAGGVIGKPLLPALVAAGYEVAGLTRTPEKAAAITATGATPIICDVLDRRALAREVRSFQPEVVVQHLTDLPAALPPRKLANAYAANDRLRSEGTANLIAAATEARARRYVAQNVCFLYRPEGGPTKDETAPLYLDAPKPFDRSARVYQRMEETILSLPGLESLILRFGYWYGPGTAYASDGHYAKEVRKRRFPIVGDGGGIFSFIHIDDVVSATTAAVRSGSPGVYNVVDDDPAPLREWLPAYAEALGAKPPRRVPHWLARLFVGSFPALMATQMRGAQNHKAKRELGWEPTWPTWREGFERGLDRSEFSRNDG